MLDYGDVHFSTEEEQMVKFGYPGFDEHKKQHKRFREIIEKIRSELDSKEDTEYLASSVQRFLIDWLILHIKTEDRGFGEFLKGKI
jgi:hemerythrin